MARLFFALAGAGGTTILIRPKGFVAPAAIHTEAGPRTASTTMPRGMYTSRMEIPAKVSVFNRTLEMKGKAATLVAINVGGFYEVVLEFQNRNHTVLFPIAETVMIFNEALPASATDFEVER